MIPPSMESIFLILSGVVLAAGVLYWFWSHIQLTQKKVQLLENAVFELRGMLSLPSSPSPSGQPGQSGQSGPSPAPVDPVYAEMAEEDDWAPVRSTRLDELHESGANDELQPGGGASHGSQPEVEVSSEKFRELFIQHEKPPSPQVTAESSLESMPDKELRRLAEQRGLTGVSELKKKELLSALRQQVTKEKEITVDLAEPEQATPALE